MDTSDIDARLQVSTSTSCPAVTDRNNPSPYSLVENVYCMPAYTQSLGITGHALQLNSLK